MNESIELLDNEQVSNLKELFDEGIGEIVTTYFEDFDSKLQAFETALQSKDFESISKLAHSLKGSSLNMGASALANTCLELEMASKANDFPMIEQQFLELKKLYPQTKAAFLDILKSK